MSKPTIIHHSADYDGIFCREIARKFLDVDHDRRGDVTPVIGWDFGDEPVEWPAAGLVYVLDLPPSCLKLPRSMDEVKERLVWIDHHRSAINQFGPLPGLQLDGVAACRLAWHYFTTVVDDAHPHPYATVPQFRERQVSEPRAVTLAGEYDVWDHEASHGDDVTFQFGLDTERAINWEELLGDGPFADHYIDILLESGAAAQQCFATRDAAVIQSRGFDLTFEGLRFLALNTARCNSQSFEAGVKPHHEGLLAFYWSGMAWHVSMYGVPGRPDVDLSVIAVRHGGGGHRQACGFESSSLPWLAIGGNG